MATVREDLIRKIEEKCIEDAPREFILIPPRGCWDVPYMAVFQDGEEVDGWLIPSPTGITMKYDFWWENLRAAFCTISQFNFGIRVSLDSKPTEENNYTMTCRKISVEESTDMLSNSLGMNN